MRSSVHSTANVMAIIHRTAIDDNCPKHEVASGLLRISESRAVLARPSWPNPSGLVAPWLGRRFTEYRANTARSHSRMQYQPARYF